MRLKSLEQLNVDDVPQACTQCGHCNVHCPTGNQLRWELASPRGKIFFTKWLRDHGRSLPKEYITRIYQCTMCARSHTECMADLDTIGLWEAIRDEIGKRGLRPKQLQRFIDGARSCGNIFARPNSERLQWAQGSVKEKIAAKIEKPASIAYFVGCLASFKPELASIPISMVKILETIKANYTILGEAEWCSGTPIRFAGDHETIINLAEHNANKFEGLGIDTVVTPCAGCYRALKLDYPKLIGPMPYQVVHSSEFISQLMKEGKLKPSKPLSGKVAYHDPCLLGRHCKVYDPPRDVLKALLGAAPLELPTNKEEALCSGAGGGVKALYPDLAGSIAGKLLDATVEVTAETLVSACPNAELNLKETSPKKGSSLVVKDLVEVVAEAIA